MNNRHFASRYLLAAGALVLPAWAFRAVLILEKGVATEPRLLSGFLADAAVGVLVCLPLLAAGRRFRWAAVAISVLWCFAQSAVYEHIRALDALPLLTHAGYLLDRTFVLGSFVQVTHPAMLSVLMLVATGLMFLAVRLPCRRQPGYARQVLCAAAIVCLLLAGHPGGVTERWVVTHALVENLHVAAQRLHRPAVAGIALAPAESEAVERFFSRDLSGTMVLPASLPPPPNVLLVILESVSSLYLTAPQGAGGAPAVAPLMPALKGFAETAVYVPQLITQQRQTNRGEYAILCGDLPSLITDSPKMSLYTQGPDNACLPAVFRDAGYSTVYLQAAPLSFMMKDVFMKRAGFQSVHGREWFTRAYAEGKWGVDDKAFFEQSLKMIGNLKTAGRPWFLTLLNVGTHHPFYMPENARGDGGLQAAAFRYLDGALAAFLSELGARGVLDDTLVVVTSDESAGALAAAQRAEDTLIGPNTGLLIARLPAGTRLAVAERFMQSDIALSILDVTGLADRAPLLSGRSVFRHYDTPRPVVFGNTYRRIVGAISIDGEYHICDESFAHCVTYRRRAGAPPGAAGLARQEMPEAERRFLWAVALRSRSAPQEDGAPKDYVLTGARVVALLPHLSRQIIYGGQYLNVAAGSQVAVSVEMQLSGASGAVTIVNELTSGRGAKDRYRKTVVLSSGERLRLSYLFVPGRDLSGLECGAYVEGRPPAGLSIRIEKATLRITQSASRPLVSASALTVFEASVTRP